MKSLLQKSFLNKIAKQTRTLSHITPRNISSSAAYSALKSTLTLTHPVNSTTQTPISKFSTPFSLLLSSPIKSSVRHVNAFSTTTSTNQNQTTNESSNTKSDADASSSAANSTDKATGAEDEGISAKNKDGTIPNSNGGDVATEALRVKVADLEKQLAEKNDQMLRSLAEADNMRKRMLRDVESTKLYAIQSFAKQLLDVADNLDRAITSVNVAADNGEVKAEESEVRKQLLTLFEGVEMTRKEMQKVLSKNKVLEYGAIGDMFDPHLHEAMFNVQDASKTKNSVVQVVKTGYKFHDRVLRPAQVAIVQ